MYRLIGFNPSPYSIKMRAVLRYRRLPFIWDNRTDAYAVAQQHGLPLVMPALVMPGGAVMNDSTPLIHELERRHPDQRSIVPPDPAQAFLAGLIEDMADEWLTKCMFHYRWYYEPDRIFGTHWVTADRAPGQVTARTAEAAKAFHDRQVGRMALVGCTEATKPVIEASYGRVLAALEAGVPTQEYLFGTRPSLADFGLFGQLQILATDPTPAAIMRRDAPHLHTWLMRLDDASGVEGEWLPADAAASPAVAVIALLRLAGEAYLPFLQANAEAIDEGRDMLRVQLLDGEFEQVPFRYQAKCYRALRGAYAALDPEARARVRPVLEESGCLVYLA